MRGKSKRNRIYGYFLIAVAVFLMGVFSAGKLLTIDETPKRSDVIIVLSGDNGDRTIHGVYLFGAGYAPYMIMSGGLVYHEIAMSELMSAHAVEMGVPAEVIITESRSDSTYQNAIFTKDIMDVYGFKSAVIVSSDYHMRRVKLIFDRVYKDSGIAISYSSADDPLFVPNRWWANNKSIMYIITEYVKIAGDLLGKNQ